MSGDTTQPASAKVHRRPTAEYEGSLGMADFKEKYYPALCFGKRPISRSTGCAFTSGTCWKSGDTRIQS